MPKFNNKITDLLLSLNERGINVSLDASKNNLKLKGKIENLTATDKELILSIKEELIPILLKNEIELIDEDIFSIQKATKEKFYPLTSSQNRLWLLSQLENGSQAYNVPYALKITGELSKEKLEESLRLLIERYEILRTSFKINKDNGMVQQWITPWEEVDFNIEEKNFYENGNNEKTIKTYLEEISQQLFDLEKSPLLRASLIKTAKEEYIFFLSLHHIITDGWSMQIIVFEVMQIYSSLIKGEKLNLPKLKIQYKDYAVWLSNATNKIKNDISEQYWLNQFSDVLPVLDLPSSKVRPVIQTYNGKTISFNFSKSFAASLKSFSKTNGVTLFMTLMTGIKIMLHKYSSQRDIIIGTPVAGRLHPVLENQIGLFLNALAIRTKISSCDRFIDLLKKEKQTLLDAYEHQAYPFEELVGKLNLDQDRSRSALFDVMVVLQNQGQSRNFSERSSLENLRIEGYDFEKKVSKFDIDFVFGESEDSLSLDISYNTDIYDLWQVENMFCHLENILSKALEQSHILISEIDYLSHEEKNQVLYHFNDTNVSYPKDKTVIDLFEEQVKKSPSNIALVFEGICLTYEELNEQANQFGRYLRDQYIIQSDSLIGVKLYQSSQMIISILGILKSGAAYVPIDPAYPEERIKYIEHDSNCIALVDEKVLENFNKVKEKYSKKNIQKINEAYDLAYVIYTSATTGNPKGVMVEHGNVVSLIKPGDFFHLKSENTYLNLSSISFDATILDYFVTLLNGSKLIIAKKDDLLDLNTLLKIIKDNKVDSFFMTPSWLNQVVENRIEVFETVKNLIVGGDVLSPTHIQKILNIYSGIKIINAYGPTENTTVSTIFEICKAEYHRIPIGKPISNSQAYILDEKLQPLPLGISGKLYVSGSGVARGYLNRAELTAEKFIPNPFIAGERMYDTGDLGRWLPDGSIDFLGRDDHQVKIRGYRIELLEIESKLLECSKEIKEVVVGVKNLNEDAVLVAYYVSDKVLDKKKLQNNLSTVLPHYMLPNYFIQLDSIPLTANGKLDRKVLQNPDIKDLIQEQYIGARTKEEEVLVAVWSEVLRYDRISMNTSFYNMGGDSIKSIQVVSRLKQKGYTLKVAQILKKPIIQDLAKLMEADTVVFDQSEIKGNVELTPVQCYFFENQSLKNKNHYNQSVVLKSSQSIDSEKLDQALASLVLHHDALRMVYKYENDIWSQYNEDALEPSYSITYYDLTKVSNELEEFDSIGQQLQSGFNISSGKLFHVGHFSMSDGDYLALIIHHLVIDAISWRIIFEDLSNLYESLQLDNVVELPLKTDSFQSWALSQKKYAKSKIAQQERLYWEELGTKIIPQIPTDYEFRGVMDESKYLLLDSTLTNKLQTQVHQVYNTEINDVLLTSLALALRDVFGIEKCVLKMEGHGREEIIKGIDISRTIGWFTSIYPFVLDVSNAKGYELISVKEALRKVPNKGVGYGILNYLDKQFINTLVPAIQFNYLGDFDRNFGKTTDSSFEFSDKKAGRTSDTENNQSQELLSISGMMISGELRMSVSYCSQTFSDKTIEKLISSYQNHLKNLIETVANAERNILTPSDLTYDKLTYEDLSKLNKDNTIEDIYELSPLQQGIYYHWLVDNSNPTYFVQTSYRLQSKDLIIDTVKHLYNCLIKKYSVLRTSFTNDYGGLLLQVVHKSVASTFTYEKVEDVELIDEYIFKVKEQDKNDGFDLTQPSLMRLKVLDFGDGVYEFIWTYHHIILDGWSMNILVADFYNILLESGSSKYVSSDSLETVKYSNYINWLSKIDKESSLEYWKNYLEGIESVTEIPFKNQETKNDVLLIENNSISLEGALYQNIVNLCQELGITHNIFIQAVWGYLLSKYNNTQDVVFGSVVSGRPGELIGVESMIGLFINSIPVRIRQEENDTPKTILRRLHLESLDSTGHHYMNLSDLLAQHTFGAELMSSLMIFENFLGQESEDYIQDEIAVNEVNLFVQTNSDFNIIVRPFPTLLKIDFKYNTSVFDPELIKNLELHFFNIVTQFCSYSETKIEDIDYLSPLEKNKLLLDFNNTKVSYPKEKVLVEWFEEIADSALNHVALVFEDKKLTYKELNEQANQLGNYLRDNYQIQPDDLIGIKLERSEKMIVSVLGVLKSGAAYVPIDIEYPKERIIYIENDIQSKIIIDEDFLNTFYDQKDQFSRVNLNKINSSTDLAYIIYTSGTTGNPKGVMVENRNLVNYITHQISYLNIRSCEKVMLFSSISFDASVEQIFVALLSGSTLFVMKKSDLLNIPKVEEYIKKNQITHIHSIPAFLENIDIKQLPSVRRVISGGEKCNESLVEKYESITSFYNKYGPTEITISCSIKELKKDSVVTIGSPISNTQIYILDKNLKLLPIGTAGYIYISGEGVARGYLNQPELTSQKFIENPFISGGRIYNSGDMGKWLPDGTIAFLGREDFQIKVSGYRIELSEIENALAEYSESVKEVVVIAKEEKKDKILNAFYTSEKEIDKTKLKDFLQNRLPAYMVPQTYNKVNSFPRTVGGKIDRNALYNLIKQDVLKRDFVQARNETDLQLIAIWKEVLSLDKVSITDDFFKIGGNSIRAIRAVFKDKRYSITELYSNLTIEKISDLIVSRDQCKSNFEILLKSKNPSVTVIGFPFAGGEAFTYQEEANFMKSYSDSVDFLGVRYFRKENNNSEKDFEDIATEISQEIIDTVKTPVIIQGQCLGNILAIKVAEKLSESNFQMEALLIGSLIFSSTENELHNFKEPISRLSKLGATLPENETDLNYFLKNYYYDQNFIGKKGYFLLLNQIISNKFNKINAPIIFVTGNNDPLTATYQEDYKNWLYVSNTIEINVIEDVGHYLLRDKPKELASILFDFIKRENK